jgi:hypothetical protein
MHYSLLFGYSADRWLAILAVALAAAGMVPLLFWEGRWRGVVVTMILALVATISAVQYFEIREHRQQIDRMRPAILEDLSATPEGKSSDQIIEDLNHPDLIIFTEAMNDLVAAGKIKQKMLDVGDTKGAIFRMRGYFVSALVPTP